MGRGILSPVRLPIPPLGLAQQAPPGFEPGVKELQSSALPLGYGANYSNTNYESWHGLHKK